MSNTEKTQLTPNSSVSLTASWDKNNTTQLAFDAGGTTWWSPSVSRSFTTLKLGSDSGNDVVTFMKGLTVTYSPQSSDSYNVLVSGEIEDSGSVYTLNGQVVGHFKQSPPSG